METAEESLHGARKRMEEKGLGAQKSCKVVVVTVLPKPMSNLVFVTTSADTYFHYSMEFAPAHQTKHVPQLKIRSLNLSQVDDGCLNGTALWLGGQVLIQYLDHHHATYKKHGNNAIELGSGIGFSA